MTFDTAIITDQDRALNVGAALAKLLSESATVSPDEGGLWTLRIGDDLYSFSLTENADEHATVPAFGVYWHTDGCGVMYTQEDDWNRDDFRWDRHFGDYTIPWFVMEENGSLDIDTRHWNTDFTQQVAS